MVANASERHEAPRRSWRQLLAPSPERLEFATRLALICGLTTLMTEIYQTPEPALAAYLPFFYNRPERTLSVILSVAFTLVIAVVIALVFAIANLVVDDAMWRVASIAVVSFGFLFLASASQLRPIAGTVALVISYALAELGTVQTGELATRALLYIELAVAIPAGISIVVNLLLAPAPRRTVEQALADRLRLSAAVLRGPASLARGELAASVREGVAPLLEELRLAALERSAPGRDLAVLRQATLSALSLMSAVDAFASSPEVELPDAVRTRLADTLEKMAQILRRGAYPVGVTLELPADANLSPLARELLASARDAVTRFAEPESPGSVRPTKNEGFLVEDAFTNPEHVQFALKATAAALFCYLLYSLLDWPGIHTCFLTCYIVAQTTVAESVEKLSLRLIGCLIGATVGIAAIVFVLPALTSIGGLMIAVFVGGWAGAYVAGGSPRISYAGFQLAFAFFLSILQGSAPAFDLTIARDRIVGIIIGNLVAYFALAHLWPVSISGRVDRALAAALKQLARVVSATRPGERRVQAAEALGSLRAAESDLELTRYEPRSIRSSPAWLATRQQAIENAQSLSALLLVSTNPGESSRVDTATRLERLATTLSTPSSTAPASQSVAESAHGCQTLSARISGRLRALEETLGSGVEEPAHVCA